MGMKQTYSIPQQVWKPTANGQGMQFATTSVEITALKLSSGGSSAHVSIYDNANGQQSNLVWVLDCSTTDNDTCIFPNPLHFKKGLYAVAEQSGNGSAEICVAGIPINL